MRRRNGRIPVLGGWRRPGRRTLPREQTSSPRCPHRGRGKNQVARPDQRADYRGPRGRAHWTQVWTPLRPWAPGRRPDPGAVRSWRARLEPPDPQWPARPTGQAPAGHSPSARQRSERPGVSTRVGLDRGSVAPQAAVSSFEDAPLRDRGSGDAPGGVGAGAWRRSQESSSRTPYPSDVSAAEWRSGRRTVHRRRPAARPPVARGRPRPALQREDRRAVAVAAQGPAALAPGLSAAALAEGGRCRDDRPRLKCRTAARA